MIKLCLLKGHYFSLDDNLSLETLIQNRQDDVLLSCNEPRYMTDGHLERAAAEFLSKLLPHGYVAKWDESTIGYHMMRKHDKELPARIDELRFKVLLQEAKNA